MAFWHVSECIVIYLGFLALLVKLSLLRLLLLLLASKVLVVELVETLNAAQVNLGGSGNDISGVDAAKRNTVDLEGTGDEEDTVREGLEVDDTLAAEATGEDDENGTGLKRRAEDGGPLGLAGLLLIR